MAEHAQSRGHTPAIAGWPGLIRLRYLVAGLTLAGMLPFLVLALVHPIAARVALVGALLIAAHGLFWLLVLRRHRARLYKHGFRW